MMSLAGSKWIMIPLGAKLQMLFQVDEKLRTKRQELEQKRQLGKSLSAMPPVVMNSWGCWKTHKKVLDLFLDDAPDPLAPKRSRLLLMDHNMPRNADAY
jgi:hypothetical protein